ncbi:D-inositol-3-phosphate glycosyltransferase [Aerococcus viridans]|uniref:Glycosyl transferase family 1 n=1 Tax=Aerococcus viridans TaxID=1377 RepID=A0AAU8UMV0_9LACT|nr:glycosyltransferase family 4 protein [Aerococcus viridans]AMC01526.1 glycosyl transferase family 1 [Aerococcus viridans]SUU14630.1 D-inositol-3-phosphate glycosyltransferase [Aerococcus viridans]
MKILHTCSYYSTSPLFQQLFDRQVADGHDIDVYVPISNQFPEERIASKASYAQTVRVFNQIERFFYFYKQNKIYQDLKSRYKTGEYDLIHAHSLFTNGYMAYQIHKEYGTPYVVAVRSNEVADFFRKAIWLRPIGLNILKHASQIVFISQNNFENTFEKYIPKKLKKELLAKTLVLPNGIDQFWHEHAFENRQGTLNEPLKIVATAKVQKAKNLLTLADYVATYNQDVAPAELHIIGPNWDQGIFDELIEKPYVNYHGPMDKNQLIAFYRTADIFALLSSPETFGLVYVEAMSQALPVIYTKGEGFDGFFPNKRVGVSVDRFDIAAFKDAVDYIKKYYPEISKNALKESKKFQWDDIHQDYIDIYNRILQN